MPREVDPRWVLPEGEPDVALPSQMSVTLGVKADACPRDAYLYLRYRGQASAGPLLRGSLGHLAFERIMSTLMVQGESSLFAPQEGEDPIKAAAEVSQTTKEWVDALAEETGWPLSEAEIDEARIMAYHMAIGNSVDPSTVVALEQAFMLELDDGGRLLGKVDLAALRPDGVLNVRDYKTSFYVPPGEDVSKMIQVPWYGAALLWGRPYSRVKCDCDGHVHLRCEACGSRDLYPHGTFQTQRSLELSGTAWASCTGCGAPGVAAVPHKILPCSECEGRGWREELGEPLGLDAYVQWVHCEQVYPRFLNAEGVMSSRTVLAPDGREMWGLADLRDKAMAASRVWRRIVHGVETREWPAKSSGEEGGHCSTCTAKSQCPIPAALRSHAGVIETEEQASEAMEWAVRQGALVNATKTEVKAYVKGHGLERLRVGEVDYGFVVTHPTSVKKKGRTPDWDGLRAAIAETVTFGTPFAVDDWLLSRPKTEFKKTKDEES